MSESQNTTASGYDRKSIDVVYAYLVSATFWLLVGTAYGLLASIKLHSPDFMVFEWLSFGRIRPIHTNTVMFGWTSLSLVGLSYFVGYRTSGVPLWSIRLAYVGLWMWNIALVAGIVTLSAGLNTGPREYREWVAPIAALYAAGVVINGFNYYKTLAARKTPEIYVSNWYILGAFCWVTILYSIGNLPIFREGLGDIVIQGYYMHTVVGMWFTPLVIGVTYWSLPRVLRKPIYSYSLGVLGFWTSLLFYTLIGAHHFIFSPTQWWLQTTAILFSVGMMVPVWSGAGNFFMTVRGSWHKVRRNYALMFILTGAWGYALASTQGTIEAFRTANIYWHFTNYTVGHSHLAMYGFVAFLIWGAIYGMVPSMTGRKPSDTLVGLHFWLAFVGACIYVISISIAGVLQGHSWVAGESFIKSIDAAAPMWLWRSIGGSMMVTSHILFAINLWKMRIVQPADTSTETSEAAA